MIQAFLGKEPEFDDSVYIAPSADIIGDVVIGSRSSIWFHVTIRGDVNRVRIGVGTNIQDNSVVHVTKGRAPTEIGDYVTIGHGVVVHGCTIKDRVLVGMGAIILDHAVIGSDTIVGAGALLTQRTEIPPRSLVLGSPARVVRQLSDEEVRDIRRYSDNYLEYNEIYRGAKVPDKNPFY